MKKFFALFLVLSMLLTAFACGEGTFVFELRDPKIKTGETDLDLTGLTLSFAGEAHPEASQLVLEITANAKNKKALAATGIMDTDGIKFVLDGMEHGLALDFSTLAGYIPFLDILTSGLSIDFNETINSLAQYDFFGALMQDEEFAEAFDEFEDEATCIVPESIGEENINFGINSEKAEGFAFVVTEELYNKFVEVLDSAEEYIKEMPVFEELFASGDFEIEDIFPKDAFSADVEYFKTDENQLYWSAACKIQDVFFADVRFAMDNAEDGSIHYVFTAKTEMGSLSFEISTDASNGIYYAELATYEGAPETFADAVYSNKVYFNMYPSEVEGKSGAIFAQVAELGFDTKSNGNGSITFYLGEEEDRPYFELNMKGNNGSNVADLYYETISAENDATEVFVSFTAGEKNDPEQTQFETYATCKTLSEGIEGKIKDCEYINALDMSSEDIGTLTEEFTGVLISAAGKLMRIPGLSTLIMGMLF